MSIIQNYNSFYIGSELGLSEFQMGQLEECFKHPFKTTGSALGGRNEFLRIELRGVGRVVIKNYSRGGIIRHFNKRTYLKMGRPRCESEYNFMHYLKKFNISSPEPVAFAFEGGFFYHAWLVTKEIQEAQTLAELSLKDLRSTQIALEELERQIGLMINNNILHVDLHPGNVLIDSSGEIYIIDFDKARIKSKYSRARLRKIYSKRWKRSILKHDLPPVLNEIMNN
jgi:3-deoxy-D-manno-octulosonic acid kinase